VTPRASQALPVHLRNHPKKVHERATVSRLRRPDFLEPPQAQVPRTLISSPSVAGHNVGRRILRLIVRATLGPGGGERWRFETVSYGCSLSSTRRPLQ